MRLAVERSALGPAASPEPGSVERRFLFSPDFLGFSGHFPGMPILPAVVQVLLASAVAEALPGSPRGVAAAENAKFLQRIGPDTEVTVRCKKRDVPEGAPPAADVRLESPEGVAATFRLVFREERESP